MTPVDHLMIFLLFVVQPLYGAFSHRKFLRLVKAGRAPGRIAIYRGILILEWTAFAVLVVAWLIHGRTFAELGFVSPGGAGFFAGLTILAAATGYLVYAWRQAQRADEAERAKAVGSIGDLQYILPNTPRSHRWFGWVSVTAGIVEETIYRGFVFWYLAAFMPMWAVVLVSTVGFGLAHSYQGIAGMLRVTVIGVAFGAFYLLTGSIWLPIVAHAVVDILQGAMIYEMLRKPREST